MSFRRMLALLAVVFLFAGLAAAQSGVAQPLQCATVAQVTPTLRAEGLTEMVGDIVITCTGGSAFVPNAQTPFVPTANITVSLSNKVTSRLISTAAQGVSEALMLIDEPGSTSTRVVVPGYGPAAAQKMCSDPVNPSKGSAAGTCNQLVRWVNPANPTVAVATSAANGTIDNPGAINGADLVQVPFNADGTAASNMWQGILVGNNQIQFQGIPVLPPSTSGISRVYRITNIRVATGVSQPVNGVSVVTQVLAYLSNSGSQSLPVNSAAVTVGFVQNSLSANSGKVNSFTQCVNEVTPKLAAILQFSELFPAAFKTRIAPVGTSGYGFGGVGTATGAVATTTNAGPTQNIPGTIYSSESGFITASASGFAVTNGTTTLGLADSGTRLQAKFANLPKGATVYVSRTNVVYNTGAKIVLNAIDPAKVVVAPAPTGSSDILIRTYAELSTAADNKGFASVANTSAPVSSGAIQLVALTPTFDSTGLLGTASATWEVLATNANLTEDYNFAVYVSYTLAAPVNSGPALPLVDSHATAALWYAPVSSLDTAQDSVTAWIPRFVAAQTAANEIFNIQKCTTLLLFPYMTTNGGYDTGYAISNTGKDPLGTAFSNTDVSCDIYPYGSWYNGSTAASVANIAKYTVTVAPGQTYSNLFSTQIGAAPTGSTGFTGYVFASCNFQYAHGFAFVTNTAAGSGNLGQTMGYLALVVAGPNSSLPRALNTTLAGENLNN